MCGWREVRSENDTQFKKKKKTVEFEAMLFFLDPLSASFYSARRPVLANWNGTEKQGQEATEQLVLAAHMPDPRRK